MRGPEQSKKGDGKSNLGDTLKKLFRPTDSEVQGPIAEPSSHTPKQTDPTNESSSHAPEMSSLSLCCIIEDEDIAFSVDVPAQARVFALKKEIQRERGQSTLQGVDPNMLELFKVCVSNE